jgi:DNA-binding CsgD family transcriptional regulator
MTFVWTKHKQIILYGVSLAILLFLVKWLELSFILIDFSIEIYVSIIAVIFTGLGIWLAVKLMKPKTNTVIVEKPVTVRTEFVLNEKLLKDLRISSRELEVLQLIAQGLSNREIAGRLFVSVPTVKTHANNLFLKMEVERRTQAIEKAKRLRLIP